MTKSAATNTFAEEEPVLGARLGRVRWTICAMLFLLPQSTTWIARSSPSSNRLLTHAIGMTEVNYGHIVGRFILPMPSVCLLLDGSLTKSARALVTS